MSPWNRPLTHTQLSLLCSLALALHIVPLLMADMPFMDDYARQQLALNDWAQVGRPVAATLFAAMGFAPGAVNIYPLPLLLALMITADALARLVRQWFEIPTSSGVLVLLPLWYQPFFLQNLSYQYDGASMALSLVACVWAIVLRTDTALRWLAGVSLVALGAGLYQPSVSVFAGLCAFEVMRRVMDGRPLGDVCRQALVRLGQLVIGSALYYATCAWMVTSKRAGVLAVDGQWLPEVYRRLVFTADVVGVLITPGVGAVFGISLCLAALSLGRELLALWRRPFGWAQRLGLMAVLLLAFSATLICIPGIILFLAEHEKTERVLMGLGVVLALLSYLAHRLLINLPRLRLVVLVMPLLFMLSFSFAYGRVLALQKELHQSIVQSLVHDLSSRPALIAARHYYLLDFWLDQPWIPAASGTLRAFPAIANINIYKYLVLPEMLPRAGIDDLHPFYEKPPLDRSQILQLAPTAQVTGRFYDIHVVGDAVYVLFKAPQPVQQAEP